MRREEVTKQTIYSNKKNPYPESLTTQFHNTKIKKKPNTQQTKQGYVGGEI